MFFENAKGSAPFGHACSSASRPCASLSRLLPSATLCHACSSSDSLSHLLSSVSADEFTKAEPKSRVSSIISRAQKVDPVPLCHACYLLRDRPSATCACYYLCISVTLCISVKPSPRVEPKKVSSTLCISVKPSPRVEPKKVSSTLCISVTPAVFCDRYWNLSITHAVFCYFRRVHKSRTQESSSFSRNNLFC